MSLCSWVGKGGSCRYPAGLSLDTHGKGRCYCIWHWRCFDLDGIEQRLKGDRIVLESCEWDGKAESYLALRLADAKREKAHDAGANGREEQEGPGVAGQLRNDAERNAPVPIVRGPLARMGSYLQPIFAADS